MNTPLRFRRRYALHAMAAGLKFQSPVNAFSANLGNNFFKPAMFAFAGAHDLYPPATRFSVTAVHAEQIAGKQRRFITTGSRTHFEEGVTFVIGVFR